MSNQWLDSRQVLDALAGHRINDVRVIIDGTRVPIASITYNRLSDMIEIRLAEDSEEYKIAMTTEPMPEPDR